MYNEGFLLSSADLRCLPGSTRTTPQHSALGKDEDEDQQPTTTDPKAHQGIHDTVSEEPVPAYKLSVERDLAERNTAHFHGGGKGLRLKQQEVRFTLHVHDCLHSLVLQLNVG